MSGGFNVDIFKHNPIPPLLNSANPAIEYFTRRDLLNEEVSPISTIWKLPEPQKLIKKQRPEGYWKSKSANRKKAPAVNYDLFETFKTLSRLVDMYEFSKNIESVQKAAQYIFSCQTDDGDLRGMLGQQYTPYYTGQIMSLLIKAGYTDEPHIHKGFDFLKCMRQNDGGWVIGSPGCMGNYSREQANELASQFVGTKQDFDLYHPFMHSGTGMVLRAYAVHPLYRKSGEAMKAGNLIKQRFFQKDSGTSYQHPDNWVNFKYPFFWTDLLSVLDSLSLMGFSKDDPDITIALTWLIEHQLASGLWNNSYSRVHKHSENSKSAEARLWISLAICRIFKRFYND